MHVTAAARLITVRLSHERRRDTVLEAGKASGVLEERRVIGHAEDGLVSES